MGSMTEDQWQLVSDKYGALIRHATRKIYCDKLVHSEEDLLQDIKLTVFKAIEYYLKKECLTFEEAWEESKLIGQYIKATIWHSKVSIGEKLQKGITSYLPVSGTVYNIPYSLSVPGEGEKEANYAEESRFLGNSALQTYDHYSIFNDLKLNDDQSKVIQILLGDFSYYKPNTRINISKVARELDWTLHKTNNVIDSIRILLTIN